MIFRIGLGNDIHKLSSESKHLWIGGVNIPFEKGVVAHSDGDVLIHSICDALLGAMANRDIGYHFPDTDPAYKNISSSKLLSKVVDLTKNQGYKINNIDCTVILQKPKLSGYIQEIRTTLANLLQIDIDNISVKAKTNEGLGPIGESEAIAAYSIVLLIKNEK
ncbi:MAG: 2-C-methyl-D-erythritol 2,4-cyclodiphosphate synthase [Bacteroidales bacterium]|jgi:2-C-methyl-D-erythritol 2,4-cyclodiphosphate synthase